MAGVIGLVLSHPREHRARVGHPQCGRPKRETDMGKGWATRPRHPVSGSRKKMRIISRIIYFVAGVSALYVVLAPALSGLPNLQPVWLTVGIWCGAILLIAGALGIHDFRFRLVAIGSTVVLALYGHLAILRILQRFGLYHVHTRLVTALEPPRWRFTFDRPMFFLLLFSALVSFGLSIQSIVTERRTASET